MSEERRNLYRILHVQPEAPAEVIKASYRTLMSTLRAHPDLGGDPQAAALINAAYAVLIDPERRQAYDRTLSRAAAAGPSSRAAPGGPSSRATTGGPSSAAAAPAGRGAAAGPAAATASGRAAPPQAAAPTLLSNDPATWLADRCCPFCRAPLPRAVHADTRCSGCDSPLMRLPALDRGELFGRRRSPRNARPMPATLRLADRSGDHPARVRDLSLTGLCVLATVAPAPRTAVRVITNSFDAVAVVVSSPREAGSYALHCELLTLHLLRASGVFVSAKA